MKNTIPAVLCLLLLTPFACAQVVLPAVLADHMVVQRQVPVHIWGRAGAKEAVSVTFRGETKSASADNLGRWSVYLSPREAGGPFDLVVRGTNTITMHDVLVGDVWVASGQSNMEFETRKVIHADVEIAAAKFPNIRLLHLKRAYSMYPLDDAAIMQTWTACTPESVSDFSAVAYFFARDVQQKEKVPIGVIDSTWGGTPAEAWTSMHALGSDAALMPVFAAWGAMIDKQSEAALSLESEKRQTEAARTAGQPPPQFPWHPELPSWSPGNLYNAMIAPLTPFAIRGVIWYQGEANSALNRASLYGRVLQTLIRDWRSDWGVGDFPFLYVQISNFTSTPQEDWPEVREGQRSALALRNTAMAVSIDIGNPDDVHPTNKQDVGARLALAARAVAYGEAIEYSGPLYRQTATEDHALRVWFDHTTGGMVAKGGALRGFEIAGADGKYVPAQAQIDGISIVVSSPEVSAPKFVRYDWANSPDGNLFNGAGLPASPFRSGE